MFWMQSKSNRVILSCADWQFRVDISKTREQTARYSFEHCTCDYCKNYYDTLDSTYPYLRGFLMQFGVYPEGPSELMPFTPTRMLACYRVEGEIIQWGQTVLSVGGIPVVPEAGEDGTFLLWVGEMELPWVQETPQEEVVSPANLPDFLERMETVWRLRHDMDYLLS